jgi:cytochrome c2
MSKHGKFGTSNATALRGAACAAVLIAAIVPARAQLASAAAGKQLAVQNCQECHVVEPTGQGGWTDAPSFAAIAHRPGVSVAALSEAIQKPNADMLHLGRPKAEADAIAAYIVSLRRR